MRTEAGRVPACKCASSKASLLAGVLSVSEGRDLGRTTAWMPSRWAASILQFCWCLRGSHAPEFVRRTLTASDSKTVILSLTLKALRWYTVRLRGALAARNLEHLMLMVIDILPSAVNQSPKCL